MNDVDLSLISHTNVGKTTLARTLLRRDVGEVRDAPHVTAESEPHVVAQAGEHRLVLWDTPGFGDTARLLRALRAQERPIRWLLAQVWDRMVDRGFWSSQQAVRHVQETSDLVLYLVNAAEEPAAAGYVRHELDLLTWIGRPVVMLLNQTGTVDPESERQLEEDWRRHVALWPIVRDVVALDAFTRNWMQEAVLFQRLGPVLDGPEREALDSVAAAWEAEGRRIFQASVDVLAGFVATGAADRELLHDPRAGGTERRRALEALGRRLEAGAASASARVLELHGLEGSAGSEVERSIEDVLVKGATDLTPQKGALIGGAVSGAMGGLAADLLAGGLTFGGGLVAGAILGAIGGVGVSRANDLVKLGGEPHVTWSRPLLDELIRQTLLRYLAVAHFGRGRGEFRDADAPASWVEPVAAAVEDARRDLHRLWKRAVRGEPVSSELSRWLRSTLLELMSRRLASPGSEGKSSV